MMPSTTRLTAAASPPALGCKCGPAAEGACCAATFAAAKTATVTIRPKRVVVRCIISSPDNYLLAKTTTDVISPGHLGKTSHVHKPESGGEWPPVCLRTMIGFGTPLQSTAETQPQLHPALLSLSAIIGEYKKTHPSVRSTVGLRTITPQARRLG